MRIGKQLYKHRARHARQLLNYALMSDDLADLYFAIKAYLNAEQHYDKWLKRQRQINKREASRNCIDCGQRYRYPDHSDHCRTKWTKCVQCAWN